MKLLYRVKEQSIIFVVNKGLLTKSFDLREKLAQLLTPVFNMCDQQNKYKQHWKIKEIISQRVCYCKYKLGYKLTSAHDLLLNIYKWWHFNLSDLQWVLFNANCEHTDKHDNDQIDRNTVIK